MARVRNTPLPFTALVPCESRRRKSRFHGDALAARAAVLRSIQVLDFPGLRRGCLAGDRASELLSPIYTLSFSILRRNPALNTPDEVSLAGFLSIKKWLGTLLPGRPAPGEARNLFAEGRVSFRYMYVGPLSVCDGALLLT
jgi:hypothetical protein